MRVIAGTARGTRLDVARAAELRPTGDRQRETLFNVLQARPPARRVLDLFAGTGALGIEALSRGAAEAVFIERDRKVASVLRVNLERCRLQERARVIVADWRAGLRRLDPGTSVGFDLILADPPWAADESDAWLAAIAGVAAPTALLCLERQRGEKIDSTAEWTRCRCLSIGDTEFHLFERSVPVEPGC